MSIAYKERLKCPTGNPVFSGVPRPSKAHHHHDFSRGVWWQCRQPLSQIEAGRDGQ